MFQAAVEEIGIPWEEMEWRLWLTLSLSSKLFMDFGSQCH
jgi:hypothetical protein